MNRNKHSWIPPLLRSNVVCFFHGLWTILHDSLTQNFRKFQFPTDFLDNLGNRRPKKNRQVAGRQVDSQSLRPRVFLNAEIFTSCLASPTVCRNLVVLDSKKPHGRSYGSTIGESILCGKNPWRRWFLLKERLGWFLFVCTLVIPQKPERPANHLFF